MDGIIKRIFFWSSLFVLILSFAWPLQVSAQDKPLLHDNWPHRKPKCPECQDAADKYNEAANKYNKVNDKIRATYNAIDSDKKGIKQAKDKGDGAIEQSLTNDLKLLEDKLDKLEFDLSDLGRDVLKAQEALYECEINCKDKPGKPLLHDNWPHRKAKCEECKSAADEYNKAADKYNKVNNKIHGTYDAIEKDKKGIAQAKAKGDSSVEQTLTTDMKKLEENVDKLEFELSDRMKDVLNAQEKLIECEQNCNKKLTIHHTNRVNHYANRINHSEPTNQHEFAYVSQPIYSGFTFTVGLKYQKYSNNGTDFATSTTSIGDTTIVSDFNVHQNYHYGYNLGLAYSLPYRGSSLNLDYSSLTSSDSSTVTEDNLFVEGTNVITATGRTEFATRLLNFTFQQLFSLNQYLDLNLYAGLNYTHLSKDMTVTGIRPDLHTLRIEAGTNFKGIGPMFGIGAAVYPFTDYYHRFGIVGDLQGLFPFGKLSEYFREFQDDTFIRDVPNEKVFIPGTKTKIGLKYDLQNNGQYILEGGYEAYISFDATKAAEYSGMTSNVSYRGIYLNLNVTPRY